MENNDTKSKRGSIVGGTILLGLGIFFLCVQMGWLPFLHRSWPVILIIVGVALLVGAYVKPRREQSESPE